MLKDKGVNESSAPHVIVVGGGIAGLVAARELVRAGLRVTLVEAGSRLGGKVASHTVGGIRLDSGAESFATRLGTVSTLLTELGLSGDIVQPVAGGAWLQPLTGPAVPLPQASLLGIPSVPLARDVIRVVGLPGALRAQLDALLSGFVGSRERNLGALVRKRMGRAVLDRLVAPVAGGIHSAHPDSLDVDIVAPRLRTILLAEGSLAKAVLTVREKAPAGSAVQGLVGGIFRLVDALAADLDGRAEILLGTRVHAADVAGTTLTDDIRLTADAVILATELGDPTGVPITLATLVVRSPALDAAPRGSGVLVAGPLSGDSRAVKAAGRAASKAAGRAAGAVPGNGAPATSARIEFRAKALTHSTAKWAWLAGTEAGSEAGTAASAVRRVEPGVHVLRLSFAAAPDADADLRELARTEAARLLGVAIPVADVLDFARVQWRGAPTRRTPAADVAETATPLVIGETISGAGLASIIGYARVSAANLAHDLLADPPLGLAIE
ncbi:MAG: FAD-dependent oxidoreductase [Burkholderiaceae bacterium]|nr:FAD-dependent oxidoreductase [Microbacteriaceae bacterium]